MRDDIARVIDWARANRDRLGDIVAGHVNAPPGMTLGEAFDLLASCAAEALPIQASSPTPAPPHAGA